MQWLGDIFGAGSAVIAIVIAGFIMIYYFYRRDEIEGILALLLGLFHLVGGICFYLGYLKWGMDGGLICSLAGPFILYVALTYEDDGKSLLEPQDMFLLLFILSSMHHRDWY